MNTSERLNMRINFLQHRIAWKEEGIRQISEGRNDLTHNLAYKFICRLKDEIRPLRNELYNLVLVKAVKNN